MPPTVLLSEPPQSVIPSPLLARAAAPAALVPIKLPWNRLSDASPTSSPAPWFPEITLPAPTAVPPMVFELRGYIEDDPAGLIGQRDRARLIRANQVPFHQVAGRGGLRDEDAEAVIAANDVRAPVVAPPMVLSEAPSM